MRFHDGSRTPISKGSGDYSDARRQTPDARRQTPDAIRHSPYTDTDIDIDIIPTQPTRDQR
jgi:hypothetical protein